MSIRPIDMQNIYLRMGEVSHEQDKEIKKENRERSFQRTVQKSREENFNHSVHQVRESHADQTVSDHEERGLPVYKKPHNRDPDPNHGGQKGSQQQLGQETQQYNAVKSPQDIALPMVTFSLDATTLPNDAAHGHTYSSHDPFDPDLGHYVNIQS